MTSNGADSPRPRLPPHRPRHQITRSISELASPIRLHRHDHSGLLRREQRERDDRTSIKQVMMPGLHAMESSLSGSKSEGVTPTMSPNPSRRASILAASGDDPAAVSGLGYSFPRKPPGDEQVKRERQRAAARVTGLEKSLADLNTFSSTTTRRLDDTYYSVLEKLGTLHSTIIALKELAGMSQETNANFKRESDELVSEVRSQLDSFGHFEEQEERIESLKGRIHAGRDKIRALSDRVDMVRERVQRWERADREWQERTRRRLKAIWIVTSAVLFVLILLLVSAQYVPASFEEATVRVANESLNYIRSAVPANGTVQGPPGGDRWDTLGSMSKRPDVDRRLPPDERLRVFDEL